MIAISKAEYAGGYTVRLVFSNGEEGVADLADLVGRYPIAGPLKDTALFKQFSLDEWPTLVWPCGFDVSPELLYERATGKARSWAETVRAEAA